MVTVGGLVVRNDRFLLVKRRFDPFKGYWCVPGGGVRKGEVLRDAVKREILEETGIVAEVIGIIDICEFPPYGRDVYITFLGRYLSGEVAPSSDAEDAKWFPLEEIERLENVTSLSKILAMKVSRDPYDILKAHTIEDVRKELQSRSSE
ncbi:MAG: NUDIX hydrolase [Candidatus Bathyarchaeota archaeon]|nr:NUDIX hydrolase [Candidatus Bathyarchaeota archaeon]MDH5687477.1 NUDIX hydrolase [Candidatus Bathyarchaeota archaeon]